jgi:hypothetical protein
MSALSGCPGGSPAGLAVTVSDAGVLPLAGDSLIAWELVTAAVNASRDPLALVTVINCWTGLGAPAGLEKMIEVVGTIRFVAGGGVTLRTTADSTVPGPTRTDTRPM